MTALVSLLAEGDGRLFLLGSTGINNNVILVFLRDRNAVEVDVDLNFVGWVGVASDQSWLSSFKDAGVIESDSLGAGSD